MINIQNLNSIITCFINLKLTRAFKSLANSNKSTNQNIAAFNTNFINNQMCGLKAFGLATLSNIILNAYSINKDILSELDNKFESLLFFYFFMKPFLTKKDLKNSLNELT